VAEPLYKEAVETGGLSATDVLDAYTHLGATRAVLGKKIGALSAFKAAAMIDPHFSVPAEAGKRAMQVANQARASVGRIGAILLRADFPSEVDAAESTQVDVTLDAAHLSAAPHVALFAEDPESGRSWSDVEDSARALHFKVPSSLAPSGATLSLRVDALDRHRNRLAEVEGKIHMRGAAPPPAPLPVAGVPAPGPFASMGLSGIPGADSQGSKLPDADKGTKKTGFWATAWPWVIGGAALAAGSVALYFAVRPTDDVSLGTPRLALSQ
jgi:hypothetical protein